MITIELEFDDLVTLEISEEGRLEIAVSNGTRTVISWLNKSQLDKLITELKIIRPKITQDSP